MDIRFAAGHAWVYGSEGLYRCAGPGEASVPLLGRDVLQLSAEAPPWLLAVRPSGKGGYLLDGESRLLSFEVPKAGAARYEVVDRRTYALEVLDEKHWALATRENRNVVVRTGIPGAENGRLKSPRTVDKTPWPEGLLWDDPDAIPYTRKKRFSETPNRLRLRALGGALALADADAGVVARWDEGQTHWSLVTRLPIRDDAHLDAWPTRDGNGLLCLLTLEDGAVLLHLDGEGNVMDHAPCPGARAAVSDGETVHFLSDTVLHGWRPGGEVERLLEEEALGGDECPPHLRMGAGGALLAADGRRGIWLHREGDGWRATPIAPPEEPPEKRAKLAKPKVRRMKGEPRLQLDGSVDPANWEGEVGALCLEVPVVNMGGPAEGLTIEVSGPARGKLFEPSHVEIRGAGWKKAKKLDLDKGKASLEATIPAGVEIGEPPKSVARKKADAKQWRWDQIPDDARLCIALHGEAKGSGQALLTVRVGLHGLGRAGSVLRGQSLTIR
ncbi:MAG: hypothetical protein CMN30_17195 [Sandaracinus sp.]|nr:hypothetical protein [Sandaracinus sp.]